jgi:hypothetical protein
MDLPPRLLARLGQGLQKVLPIDAIAENVLPPVSRDHHSFRAAVVRRRLVDRARILNSHFSRHLPNSAYPTPSVNRKTTFVMRCPLFKQSPSAQWGLGGRAEFR